MGFSIRKYLYKFGIKSPCDKCLVKASCDIIGKSFNLHKCQMLSEFEKFRESISDAWLSILAIVGVISGGSLLLFMLLSPIIVLAVVIFMLLGKIDISWL